MTVKQVTDAHGNVLTQFSLVRWVIRGEERAVCILDLHDGGVADVEDVDTGQCYRHSGLPWGKVGATDTKYPRSVKGSILTNFETP